MIAIYVNKTVVLTQV